MKSTMEISSQTTEEISNQLDFLENNTASLFLEAYHRKLYMKAQKIIETHPFYIIRLAK